MLYSCIQCMCTCPTVDIDDAYMCMRTCNSAKCMHIYIYIYRHIHMKSMVRSIALIVYAWVAAVCQVNTLYRPLSHSLSLSLGRFAYCIAAQILTLQVSLIILGKDYIVSPQRKKICPNCYCADPLCKKPFTRKQFLEVHTRLFSLYAGVCL